MNSIVRPQTSMSGGGASLRTQGIVFAILSAITFGLIPLFSIPVLRTGISTYNVLFYRFAISCVALLVILLLNRKDLRLNLSEVFMMMIFGLLYDGSAVCLYYGYKYMSSGVATTLIFMYPVWTAIIMALFFKERLAPKTILAIMLALGGVYFLSGDQKMEAGTPWFVISIVMLSGLSYSIYMVMVDRLNVREMGSLKLTFYVFLFALLFLTIFLYMRGEGIEPVSDTISWINLIMLGIIPTVLSNILMIKAIVNIGSTLSAIFGAFEPVMAVVIGVTILAEPFTLYSGIGILLIIGAVILLVIKKPARQGKGTIISALETRQ